MIEQLTATVLAWQGLGLAGLAGFTLIFVAGTLTFMPRFTLYAIGGLVFGPLSIPAAIIGSVTGATAAFLLARTALNGAFQRQVEKRPAWRRMFAAIDAEGWRLVALTRLASPLPGGTINYLFGLTGIGLVPYIAATAGGLMLPVTLFAGAGIFGRIALQDVERPGGEGAVAAAGLIVIAITVLLVRRRIAAMASPPR